MAKPGGCSGSSPKGSVRLLLDGNYAPDVLVERRVIAWPPALGLEAAWLRSRLLAWAQRGRMPEKGSEEVPVDRETQEKLRALGYAN